MKLIAIIALLNALTTSATPVQPPTPTPSVLLPPPKFHVRVLSSPYDNAKEIGWLHVPGPPVEGSLLLVLPSPTVLYFNQKNTAGLGWIANGPVFYAPTWYILSYTSNGTAPDAEHTIHSPIYLDNTVNSATDGFNPLVVQTTNKLGNGDLYFEGLLPGPASLEPATFSYDTQTGELFINSHG
jgi:hypothetical protein